MKYDKDFDKVYHNFNDFLNDNVGGLPSEGELTRIYNNLPEVEIVKHDSESETLQHIKKVSNYLMEASKELLSRAQCHDNSKLSSKEKPYFDELTDNLKSCTYGSDEYNGFLAQLKPALDNHYALNSHHPEHYENGLHGMNLFDLIEMFFDWKAAGERHADGNIFKSIDLNQTRFKMSDQLRNVFENTAKFMNYE